MRITFPLKQLIENPGKFVPMKSVFKTKPRNITSCK